MSYYLRTIVACIIFVDMMSGFLCSQPITLAFHVILKHNFIIVFNQIFYTNKSMIYHIWYESYRLEID